MISEEVRAIETEIDERIRQLGVWKSSKSTLLRRFMNIWRDCLEVVYMTFAHGAMFQNTESFKTAIATEHQTNTGVFWCLKWAFEYASDDAKAASEPIDEQLVDAVMNVGASYQLLVDALKLARVAGIEFGIDHRGRALIIYEGGNASGYDHAIVDLDHASLPFHGQTPLIDDSDHLTSRWTAGEYREYWRWLRGVAERAETETILAQAGPLAPKQEIFKRPVVLELPEPPLHLEQVQKDLTLTQRKIDSGMKWIIDSWLDCPLVQIGSSVYGISTCLQALAGFDDYMLRVAVLNDREQYEKVSGLREERMLAFCQERFASAGWESRPHFRLQDPLREIDCLAFKGRQDVVVQLKSTLRPHSPWEVYKRNSDLIDGITHTREVLPRFRAGALGFVVTDGYEGDYATWKESMRTRVPVATLKDVTLIASNPAGAFQLLAERAGIEGRPTAQPVPERVASLCGWTLRLVDSAKPA